MINETTVNISPSSPMYVRVTCPDCAEKDAIIREMAIYMSRMLPWYKNGTPQEVIEHFTREVKHGNDK